ncbi:MAG: TetR/AcrR family transcriptional regulator [Proteobacteria bacterium]|nr:TetR/AcrR family transcriptional regulator [Pseudomonadota bacterium]MCP4920834.1 TetR/AcrR family transcriptional regulator [Pseudomonadota bacterium]
MHAVAAPEHLDPPSQRSYLPVGIRQDPVGTPDGSTRDRIVFEATRLFAEQGYAGTSVREIVEASGVTKPTLYYWFGNKEGLFTQLVDVHLDSWNTRLAAKMREDIPVTDRIRAYIRTVIQDAMEKPEVVAFLAQAFHQAGQGAPAVDCNRFLIVEARLLTELAAEGIASGELRAGLDPSSVALVLMGAAHTRIGASVHAGVPLTLEAAEATLEILLSGVMA